MANYRREVRIGENIWKKRKIEKVIIFVEQIKRVQKKARAVLKRV